MFQDTFYLQVIADTKPYEALQRHMAYALEEPFKKQLERLQERQILAPLGVEKMAKWCAIASL